MDITTEIYDEGFVLNTGTTDPLEALFTVLSSNVPPDYILELLSELIVTYGDKTKKNKYSLFIDSKTTRCKACEGAGTVDIPHGSIDCATCYGIGKVRV